MRDLFAILAIILAVVSLGIFRVPDQNALVAAGIRSGAEAALYQQPHPLTVEVKGRVVTVSGRVESDAARQVVLQTLTDLDGVEKVVDHLTVLPQVAPFALTMTKAAAPPEATPDTSEGTDAGTITYTGHLPSEALATALTDTLGTAPDLPLGAGAPPGFADVAETAATALAGMLDGQAILTDTTLTLTGSVHLPSQRNTLETLTLAEGWTYTPQIIAVDDGLPYSLLASRDPLMGLRLTAKLPPVFDTAPLDALSPQETHTTHAPLPLDQPGFSDALTAALPIFADLPEGTLTVAPFAVTLTGGPVPPALIARAQSLTLPEGYALTLALTPEDTGPPLTLSLHWDGSKTTVEGRVPRDFPLQRIADMLGETTGTPDRSPYPDLTDWSAQLWPGIAALKHLDSGTLTFSADNLTLTGTAADPGARALAARALGAAGTLDASLKDDGTPAAFTLTWDAGAGGSVTGKLPADLTPAQLAESLGTPPLRGTPRTAPTGTGADTLRLLKRLAPHLPQIDRLTLEVTPDGTKGLIALSPGLPPDALPLTLPETILLATADAPPSGTRRTFALTGQPQVFAQGHWLPDIGGVPTPEACAETTLPPIPFAENRFALPPVAFWPLADWAALARACTRFNGLTMTITVTAPGTLPELARQLARRRAEAIREALIQRGLSPDSIQTEGREGPEAQTVSWR